LITQHAERGSLHGVDRHPVSFIVELHLDGVGIGSPGAGGARDL
jgi:hypothetical protein